MESNKYTEALKHLSDLKRTEFLEAEEQLSKLTSFFPKSSKFLSLRIRKNILETRDNLSLIITIHLYSESMLNSILDKLYPQSKALQDFRILDTYYKKLTFLFFDGKLSQSIYEDLKALNSLRNKLAHKIEFDLTTFDFLQFSVTKNSISKAKNISKSQLNALNRIILRIMLFNIEEILHRQHKLMLK